MRKEKILKVYGGRYYGHQFREGNPATRRMIIAAYTKKQAMELGEISYSELNNYFSLTGNEFELSIPTEPGVWILSNDGQKKLLGRWK